MKYYELVMWDWGLVSFLTSYRTIRIQFKSFFNLSIYIFQVLFQWNYENKTNNLRL